MSKGACGNKLIRLGFGPCLFKGFAKHTNWPSPLAPDPKLRYVGGQVITVFHTKIMLQLTRCPKLSHDWILAKQRLLALVLPRIDEGIREMYLKVVAGQALDVILEMQNHRTCSNPHSVCWCLVYMGWYQEHAANLPDQMFHPSSWMRREYSLNSKKRRRSQQDHPIPRCLLLKDHSLQQEPKQNYAV